MNVARGLARRGDRVTVLTSDRHADRIRAAGAIPAPLPPAADYDDSAFDAELVGRAQTSGIARINFDVEQVFVRPMPHQFSALQQLLGNGCYDAIVADALFLGVLPMLLDESTPRPPILTYCTTPLLLSSADTAPGGLGIRPMAGPLGRLRNRVLTALTQQVLMRPSQRAADRMLAAMGLPKLPTFVLDSAVLADRVIVPTIPEFEYQRSDAPAHVCFVGAVNPLPCQDFTPPPWWDVLDVTRPVVHVTQGTIDNADLSRLIEPTIQALADQDVTVVVTTGGRPVSQIRVPLPANTFVAEYLPHDILLPRVDVMVTNGGYGAVQRALCDGVPLVVAGKTEDKAEVAARVEHFGVGVNLRTGTPTAGAVKRAVRGVLDDPTFRGNARRLRAAHAARDSVAAVGAIIDGLVAEKRERLHSTKAH